MTKCPLLRFLLPALLQQGEAGAYSEKSLRELLGKDVVAVGQESFEDTFKAVSAGALLCR